MFILEEPIPNRLRTPWVCYASVLPGQDQPGQVSHLPRGEGSLSIDDLIPALPNVIFEKQALPRFGGAQSLRLSTDP